MGLSSTSFSNASTATDGLSARTDDPAKVHDAAQQFEALLIGQILKEVAASAESSGLGEADSASGSMMEMAQEHLAQAIATRGGFGLTAMVMRSLESKPTVATESRNGGSEQTPAASSNVRL